MIQSLPDALRRLAEDLNYSSPQRPGEERVVTARYVACLGPGGGPYRSVVQRLRLAGPEQGGDELTRDTVEEVRELLRARGRRAATWEVGPSATPADLGQRLQRLGMTPDEGEPLATAMVLRGAPAVPAPDDVTVRRVSGWEDYHTSCQLLERCFGVHGDEAELRAEHERGFEEYRSGFPEVRYLALLGGTPVAAGVAVRAAAGVVLGGGATLPEARGRGAYRALVHARWREAQGEGGALVTQAGALSRPILRRLGFEEVAAIHIYRDVL